MALRRLFAIAGPLVRGLTRFALLWLALLAISAVVAFEDDFPIAMPNSSLSIASATLAAIAGLALLYLGGLRFQLFGRPLDLFVGGGFGMLAVANLVVRIALPAARAAPAPAEAGLDVLLLLRAAAAGLFVIPLLSARAIVAPADRRRYARRVGLAAGIPVTAGVALIVAAQDRLPPAIGPRGRALLNGRAVVFDALPDQAAWLLAANGTIGVLMLLATIGYSSRAERDGDPYLGALVAPFILLTFGQFHALLFPPVEADYISTALGLRLCAFLALLASLISQAGRDLGERAAADERRRLSRELHDGLMQQLSLLNLRLNHARSPGRDATVRDRDLAAAARVLEAALIEARQAIVALRSGVVAWDSFVHTLGTFADEFAANHDVAVNVRATGGGPDIDAVLQAEILRMLHEACSNALRHGAARGIDVAIDADTAWLTLCIRDDGRGFAASPVGEGQGVGLSSLSERVERRGGQFSIESAPGQGATLRARLRLGPRERMVP